MKRVSLELTEQQSALLEWIVEQTGRTAPQLFAQWLEAEQEAIKKRMGLR